MLEKLDNWFLQLAKRIINLAAFFGISRRQTMNIWIVFTVFCQVAAKISHLHTRPSHIIFTHVTVWIITGMVLLWFANVMFRDDDILPRGIPNIALRLILILMYPLQGLTVLPDIVHAFLVSVSPSPFFFYYILLNQSPQNPVRLKNLLKKALGKIASIFQPSLQPTPIPIAPR